jgi:hypothetical protein
MLKMFCDSQRVGTVEFKESHITVRYDDRRDFTVPFTGYQKIQRYENESSRRILDTINAFFDQLTPIEQGGIHFLYHNHPAQPGLYREFFATEKLIARILEFCRTDERMLASRAKVFTPFSKLHKDIKLYEDLLVLSFICKMMIPIWGNFFYKTQDFVRSLERDGMALMLLDPALRKSSLNESYMALQGHVADIVLQEAKKHTPEIAPMDVNILVTTILSSLITKALTIFVPFVDDDSKATENILIYVKDAVLKSTHTRLNMVSNNSAFRFGESELREIPVPTFSSDVARIPSGNK